MSELEKVFLTSGLTILGGVIVYVIGQILSKFFIEPIHEQKKLIGEIADSLIFYSNIYTNPGMTAPELMKDAHEKLRQQATLLISKTHMIPKYNFFSRLGVVISEKDIEGAFWGLIFLSNSVFQSSNEMGRSAALTNDDMAEKIKKLLKLRIE